MNVQVHLELHCPHMSEDLFMEDALHLGLSVEFVEHLGLHLSPSLFDRCFQP